MALSPGTGLGPHESPSPPAPAEWGEVYKTRDPRLSRYVAIKVLRPGRMADEARAQTSEHRRPLDIAVESGETCLVMDCLERDRRRGFVVLPDGIYYLAMSGAETSEITA